MSLFSASLEAVIRDHNWSQTEAAATFGLSPSAITNYLSGRRPAPEQLNQICTALDDHDRGLLLAAHLRDELPASYRDLVTVTEVGQSLTLREEALAAWQRAELPPNTRAALDLIATQARSDEIVRDWLEASAELLRHKA
jgi:transcriptional regulator with XRE-family HTH domain